MNPLPRFAAMALFVLLTALVALLAMPVWRNLRMDPSSLHATNASATPAATSRAMISSQRLALGIAVAALGLTVTLILGLAMRPARPMDTTGPFAASRKEFGTLARLAESSIAQGAELSRERDVRRRAEEDVRLKQQLLAQALDEKIRLGRDLHDGIIQSLYAAGLTLESVRARMKTDPAEADRLLEKTRTGLNDAIRDVRAYIVGLAPENLRQSSFAQGLRTAVSELGSERNTEFDITIDEDAAACLSPEQSIEALQIAREAVSNALRHGGATRITLRMHKSDRELCLLVQDNGSGFTEGKTREGSHGLVNMRARAEKLGASLRVSSQPGEGSRVLATLPIIHPGSA